MDWKEAVLRLAAVGEKLAFKPELLETLRAHTKQANPPQILMAQLEVMASVAKQNQRVANLHGYPGLEAHAKKVEAAIQEVMGSLRDIGVKPAKSQQAGQI